MAREFFKNLPNTSTPINADRLNGLLDGEEAMGNLVVDSIKNKNLLSLTNLINNGTGRTSYSINGNNITITTLSSGTYRFVSKIIDNLEIGKTYTIHIAYWNDTNVDMLAQWGVTTPDGSNYYGNSPITLYQEQKLTFVPTETSVQFRVGYLTNSCTAGDILTVGEIQLEEGSEPTWFAPYDTYSNKALANEDVVVGSIRSKNIFDKGNIDILNERYVDSSGVIVYGAYNKMCRIKLEPNTTYTLQQSKKSNVAVRVALFNALPIQGSTGTVLGTFSGTDGIVQTFTTTSTEIYLAWVYCNTNNLGNYTEQEMIDTIQVETGPNATLYKPFQNLNVTDIVADVKIKLISNSSSNTGIRITFTHQSQQFFIFGKSYKNSSDRFWQYHMGLNNGGLQGGTIIYKDISSTLSVAPTLDNTNKYITFECGSYTRVLIISTDDFDVNAI